MKVPGLDSAKIEKDLAFTVPEFKRRLVSVREQMKTRELDVLLVTTPENIYYLSGYQTPGYYCAQCLIVPLDGEPIHLTRGTEETNARMLSWLERTDSYMDHESPVDLFAQTLKDDGFERARIGLEKVSWFLPVADFERLERFMRLDAALGQLSEEHRVVVLLHDTEGYKLKEIQDITGIPVGTIKSRLHRARARLREILSTDGTLS